MPKPPEEAQIVKAHVAAFKQSVHNIKLEAQIRLAGELYLPLDLIQEWWELYESD